MLAPHRLQHRRPGRLPRRGGPGQRPRPDHRGEGLVPIRGVRGARGGEDGGEAVGSDGGQAGEVGQGDDGPLGQDPLQQAGPAGGLAGLQLLGAADPGGGAADDPGRERVEDDPAADGLVTAAVPQHHRLEHVQDQRPLQVQPDQGVAARADLGGVERLEAGCGLGRARVDQVGAAGP
ncbi:MAG TPA: hypothetical protein VL330_27645, partial [Actinomycetes bacterium]|nr:hypothetical protein [Actinomycetes bacterium]